MDAWTFVILFLANGLVFVLLGYLIKAKQMANVIAGYDERKVKDKRGLTDWVGRNIMLIGLLLCLYGFLPLLYKAGIWVHLGFAGLLLVLVVRTAVGANRF